MINLLLIVIVLTSQTEEDPLIYEMGGITVTGKRIDMIPNLILEIDPEELQLREAKSVGEALRFTPSVYSRKGSKGENYIQIFGIEQREIKIMIDGHPIRSPYDGTVDLEQIPLDNISKIEVAIPPVSLLNGTNSMGGAVNIVTKKEARTFSIGYEQEDNVKASMNFGNKFNDFYYLVTGGYNKSNGYPLPDGEIRDNSDFNRRTVSGKIGWEQGPGTEVALSVSSFWDEKGIPPGADRPRYWRFDYWNWSYAALHGKTRLSDNIHLRGSAFYDKQKNTLISYEDSTYTTEEWRSFYDNNSYGSLFNMTIETGNNLTSTIGASYKYDDVNLDATNENPEEYDGKTYTVSLQENIVIPELNTRIEGEIGYDGFKGTDSEIGTYSYRLGGIYLLGMKNTIFGSMGRKIRFPTLKELYSTSTGNPDLDPEYSLSFQAGINTEYLKLLVYRNKVENLIDREDRYTPFENLNWAIFQGFTVTGRYEFLNTSYTYLDAYDHNYEELDDRARHTVNMGLTYRFDFGLGLNINNAWVGERKDGDETLEPYNLLNASISQKISENFRAKLTLSNILNESYEDALGFPLPGRNIGAELLVNL